MNAQHAGLGAERWREFTFGRRVLMIANELHRARKLAAPEDQSRRRSSLERVLALADLTIEVESSPTRRRELLRWREIAGESYLAPSPVPEAERLLLRVLLQLSPEAASQVEFVAA